MQRMRKTMYASETGSAIQVRVSGSLYDQLENWRRAQPKIPARSEALRTLIEKALAAPDGASAAS
jgi:hypothetical protein